MDLNFSRFLLLLPCRPHLRTRGLSDDDSSRITRFFVGLKAPADEFNSDVRLAFHRRHLSLKISAQVSDNALLPSARQASKLGIPAPQFMRPRVANRSLQPSAAHTATAQISICANIMLFECCVVDAAFIESFETKLPNTDSY
jgi:hypothetical protein